MNNRNALLAEEPVEESIGEPVPAWVAPMAAVLLGTAMGVLTLAGQAVLDEQSNRLANSGAVWATVAFVVGALSRSWRSAALWGFVSLLVTLVSYDIAARIAAVGLSTSGLAVWAGTAAFAGPTTGVAGWLWRSRQPRAFLGPAWLAAIYAAEGISSLIRLPDLAAAGLAEIVVGIAIALLLPRSNRGRARALAAMVPLTAAGVGVYVLLDRVLGA